MTHTGASDRPAPLKTPRCALLFGLAIMFPLPPTYAADSLESEDPPPPEGRLVLEAEDIGGVDVRTGTLLLSGQEGGNVDGALLWALGEPNDDGLVEVSLIVEVDGAPLIEGLDGRRIAIAFLAYALDDQGLIAGHLAQGVVLDNDLHSEFLASTGLKFLGSVALTPGDYDFRVMVRESATENFFLTRSRAHIASRESDPQGLQPLLFPDRSNTWIVVRQRGVSPSLPIDDQLSFVPAARPVLVEGEDAMFFFNPTVSLQAETFEFDVLDSADRLVAEYPVDDFEAPSDSTLLGSATLRGMDLPPGRYTLLLSPLSGDSSDRATLATEVLLVSHGEPRMWVGRSNPRSMTDGAEDTDQVDGRFIKRQARAAYLDSLRQLVAGDETAARTTLGRLERHAATRDVLRSLRRVEDDVAVELEERNPRSLIPVALIHHQMVRRYVAHREFVLAARSRNVTAELAIRIGRSGAAPGFAEALLVSLASDLSRSANASLATSYIESALVLDPDYRPALLALGANLERSAEYEDASRIFRRIVEADPDSDEGRLRLAINLVRGGNERAAAKQFRELVDRRPGEWIAILTAQEYARLMIVNNRLELALDLLDRTIQTYPGDQRLQFLKAWVLESGNRSLDSVETLLHIPPAEERGSARFRYGEWPDLGPEVSSKALRETAAEAMTDLAAALGIGEEPS